MNESDKLPSLIANGSGIRLTVLGSGGGGVSKNRHMPAFLLEYGKTKVLLDAGYGTLYQILKMGYKPTDLAGVCISHFHGDHFTDLLHILDVIVRQEGDNLRPRTVVGPMGLTHRLSTLYEVYKYRKSFFPKQIQLLEFVPWSKCTITSKIGESPILIKPFEVNHVRTNVKNFPCLGFVCWAGNKKLVYTGDIGPEQNWNELEESAYEADLLIIPAGARDDSSVNHITAARAIEFARRCEAKITVLNHISEDRVQAVSQTIRLLCVDGSILLAEDFQVIDL